MGISELIAKIGDENITFQNLLHSSPQLNKGKKEGKITFSTSNENVGQLMGEVLGLPDANLVAFVLDSERQDSK